MQISRSFDRNAIAELPEGPSADRVSPSAEPVGEVAVTPSPASGDDRNPNSLAHLSDEAKVIAAKEAIAVYARNKQLPSAEMLATFGELDRAKTGGSAAAVGEDLAESEFCTRLAKAIHNLPPAAISITSSPGAPANINRHAHRLSSESLSRAADQIWGANSGGSYADLVCSRAERLAEMVYRGDAAADGQRG